MIIEFSVKNFGSIRDKQTISFEADKSTHLEEHYIIKVSKYRILKLALIYGANASGKTTILKALDFLRELVLEPLKMKTDKLNFTPFLFDKETSNENSLLSIKFLQNGIKYYYEIEFNKNSILKEELFFYNPNKSLFYKRDTDIKSQYTSIKFGPKVKIDASVLERIQANTLWNNTVLGGFFKINIKFDELREVIEWFGNYLSPIVYSQTNLEKFVTSMIEKSKIEKTSMISILKNADLHISDINIKKKEEVIPQEFLKLIENDNELEKDSKIKEIISKGTVERIEVEFGHNINGNIYTLPIDSESEGTSRFYGFAGLLLLLINTSTIFPIDELETSLHPDLYQHFLLSFLVNSKQSQLIATTHNREILDNKDLFRNDAIWFTRKDNNCSTELYSLSDFDSSVVRNTTNVLNAYKSGKLSGIPNLGDYYIDLHNEKK
ncbi:MAG: ATP-binding protein [Bacteroidales bacterium]|nr:ATP-binding protein [Bacteroidales bacterium]MDD4067691.1 ATP-binding protein [Bacteroidales bacterium]MDD4739351.1 ATP-binding protein [Bacteroidales bacterium]